MAATMSVSVEMVNGDKATLAILPKTIVAFERKFKIGLGAIATDSKMEYIYWLAWDASHVAGQVVKPFDDWLNDVVSVEADEDEVPLDKTPSLPS
jgi:hypothetical protein